MSSSSGRLPATLAQALAARGFNTLTPIQKAVLQVTPPPGEMGGDLAIFAPTGSGKTVSFGLAMSPHLPAAAESRPDGGPLVLVVAPTRDLSTQVARELAWLHADGGVRVVACTGGGDRAAERAALACGAEIVVGSPGRLCDHLTSGALARRGLRCLVLDEADELLERGFIAETGLLIGAMPADCQLVLCSATIAPQLLRIASELRAGIAPRLVTADEITSAAPPSPSMLGLALPQAQIRPAIGALLRRHLPTRALVFGLRREGVRELAVWLRGSGFRVVALTGEMTRRQRSSALRALEEGRADACIATDLAARGLDLAGIGLIVHVGLPHGPASLVHRNGRAGRGAGTPAGTAVLVVTPAKRRRADALAARAGIALEWIDRPE